MKKKYCLCIDTSQPKNTLLSLETTDGILDACKVNELNKRQIITVLEKICMDNSISLQRDIESIRVNTGPGSFTGIRVGIAVAKTVGVLLGICVNDRNPEADISPTYSKSAFDV